MKSDEIRGRQASVDGFAHEHRRLYKRKSARNERIRKYSLIQL